MITSNNSAVVIKPRHPYIKWANACSPDGFVYSPDYFKECSIVILVPPCASDTEAKRRIDASWQSIFTEMLRYWNPDEMVWPEEITKKSFWWWFDAQFHPIVIDLTEDAQQKTA